MTIFHDSNLLVTQITTVKLPLTNRMRFSI